MCANTTNKDIRTKGYVLRRTDYAEADRILNLITPVGKISAMAKGARRPKSKLAGGIEMFCLSEFNLHQGKRDLWIVTSAKMVKYYGDILKDFERMQLAGTILKRISAVSENAETEDFFKITDSCLTELNRGGDMELVESWFWLNLARVMGEEINLYRDVAGAKLMQDSLYQWDEMEMSFVQKENGEYGADEIKLLRLMLTTDFDVLRRVKMDKAIMDKIYYIAKTVVRM